MGLALSLSLSISRSLALSHSRSLVPALSICFSTPLSLALAQLLVGQAYATRQLRMSAVLFYGMCYQGAFFGPLAYLQCVYSYNS